MSTEKRLFATVAIKPNWKNCFVELSDCLAKQWRSCLTSNVPSVIGIENSVKNIAYASWIPSKSSNSSEDKQVISIGKSFADCIGLNDDDVVSLHSVLNAHPCQKVCVAPVNSEEWEILDLNSYLIEQTLLEQIRVVYPGLEFPIFLKGSAVVVLKIDSLVPIVEAGYLEEFTELHIAPKSSGNRVMSASQKSEWKDKLSVDSLTHSDGNQDSYLWEKLNNAWTYFLGSSKRTDNDMKCLSHYGNILGSTKSNETNIYREVHVDEVLRVHPFPNRHHKSNENYSNQYNYKPFNLHTSTEFVDLIKSSCTCMKLNDRRRIILKVFKNFSPKERDDKKKSQKKGGHKISVEPMIEKAAYVEMFSLKEELEANLFDQSRWASVSNELMAYIDASQNSLLGITCTHKEASALCGIIINVVEMKDKHLDAEKICSMFQKWVEQRLVDNYDEMVVNDSMVIELEDLQGRSILASVNFQSKEGGDDKEKYFFINKDSLENVTIIVKFEDNKEGIQKYSYLQKYFQKNESVKNTIGGFDELLKQGQTHLEGLFQYNISLDGHRCQHKGCLLICGSSRTTASGCGRTALSKVLCDVFRRSPYFCHLEIIDCIPLRGKKPETIIHRFGIALEEARWRQPSIVVFDDLDALIMQPDPVKDAEPTIIYHSKLAEGLKDLLREEISSTSNVAIILISKTKDMLHEVFSSPSGWHFVAKSLVIRPPDEEAREDISRVILDGLYCKVCDDCELRSFARLTEGYLPADLEIVLNRAKNASIRDEYTKGAANELHAISEENFREALFGYKPLGLYGIELHKPGILGWDDVGGLTEAKRVLQETFVWPMKFSSLFSNCPFKLRSGVLLYGPSGTGKTFLAGIVAKECGMNFISIKGPELLSKYVGSSEQNVRDLFARAQSASPCILFFDEFDALAPKRGHDNTGVTDRVVNQLLTQLDGVEKLENVFILASTSRPDLVDPALLRPGRLDKCVYCPMPDENDRSEILKCLSKDLKTDGNIDWSNVGARTADFSGADLKALLYNAQLNVIHKRKPLITDETSAFIEELNISSEDFSIEISEEDVMEALKDTSPSVTVADLKQYEARFDNFSASRKGKLQPIETGFRVTLA